MITQAIEEDAATAGPTDGEERCTHVERSGPVANRVVDPQTRFAGIDLLHRSAGDDVDAARPESPLECDRDVDIGSRQDSGPVLEKRDFAAEVGQDRGCA